MFQLHTCIILGTFRLCWTAASFSSSPWKQGAGSVQSRYIIVVTKPRWLRRLHKTRKCVRRLNQLLRANETKFKHLPYGKRLPVCERIEPGQTGWMLLVQGWLRAVKCEVLAGIRPWPVAVRYLSIFLKETKNIRRRPAVTSSASVLHAPLFSHFGPEIGYPDRFRVFPQSLETNFWMVP
jgi:hypothetical protein